MTIKERLVWRHAGADFTLTELIEGVKHAGPVFSDNVRVRTTAEGFEVFVVENDDQYDLEDLRVVEGVDKKTLTSLDDDAEVMAIPLRLDEACVLDFDKHMDDIVRTQDEADARLKKHNDIKTDKRAFDDRYLDHARNRIRYNKKG